MIEARKLYQKLNWAPPFCNKLHASMIELELSQETVDVKVVRQNFTTAVQQFGKEHPGEIGVIFKINHVFACNRIQILKWMNMLDP